MGARRIFVRITPDNCVLEASILAFKSMKKKPYLVHLWGETVTRQMVKVTLDSVPVLIDATTGTLFDIKTGRARTSPFVYILGPA